MQLAHFLRWQHWLPGDLAHLRARREEHPQIVRTSYDADKWTFYFVRSVCDLFA